MRINGPLHASVLHQKLRKPWTSRHDLSSGDSECFRKPSLLRSNSLRSNTTGAMSVEKAEEPDKESSRPPKALKKAPKKGASLANGRPPKAEKSRASVSHKKTRDQIRSHHQLNKQLAAAQAKEDDVEVAELKKRIKDLGGLQSYQLASIQGQAKDRGGDSSTILMQWLKPLAKQMVSREHKIRLLEIGALSTSNACSKSGLFDIERIDLFSQAEGILEQDFMKR